MLFGSPQASAKAFKIPSKEHVLYFSGHPQEKTISTNVLKVLSWNIQKNMYQTSLREYSTMTNYDLLLMQEFATLDPGVKQNREANDYFLSMATSFITPVKKTRTGVATIGRFRPLSTDFLRSEEKEPVIQTRLS